jgi:hypothetical protein
MTFQQVSLAAIVVALIVLWATLPQQRGATAIQLLRCHRQLRRNLGCNSTVLLVPIVLEASFTAITREPWLQPPKFWAKFWPLFKADSFRAFSQRPLAKSV